MKRLGLIFVLIITTAAALPVHAQQGATPQYIAFNGFSVTYTSDIGWDVTITHVDMTGQMVEGPVPIEPPHVEIVLIEQMPQQAGQFDVVPPTAIRVYRIADAMMPEYEYSMSQITAVISIDGTDGAIVHRIKGVDPGSVFIGLRVEMVMKPKNKREGGIFDIDHFKPTRK